MSLEVLQLGVFIVLGGFETLKEIDLNAIQELQQALDNLEFLRERDTAGLSFLFRLSVDRFMNWRSLLTTKPSLKHRPEN